MSPVVLLLVNGYRAVQEAEGIVDRSTESWQMDDDWGGVRRWDSCIVGLGWEGVFASWYCK